MNDAALFEASVPVLRHYLQRIEMLLSKLPDEHEVLLQERLAPHGFSASEHLQTAAGFASRTVLPLMGRTVPDSDDETSNRDGLVRLVRARREWLEGVSSADFDGASRRLVSHEAGTAALSQDAATFVTTFALPNFFFHLSTAFAVLRLGGVDIGKADFDGQHRYEPGFHFASSND